MQRAPFPPRKSLTLSAWVFYFCPTHPPCGGSGIAAGGLSRVWTALLQQRSWLSHLRAKIFSQEPTAEAALKGAQHGTIASDEGVKGRGTSGASASLAWWCTGPCFFQEEGSSQRSEPPFHQESH